MKLSGIHTEKPLDGEYFLKLVERDGYIELQAVDVTGMMLIEGHLLKIVKSCGKVKFKAYSGVSDELNILCDENGRIIVEKF